MNFMFITSQCAASCVRRARSPPVFKLLFLVYYVPISSYMLFVQMNFMFITSFYAVCSDELYVHQQLSCCDSDILYVHQERSSLLLSLLYCYHLLTITIVLFYMLYDGFEDICINSYTTDHGHLFQYIVHLLRLS